MDIFGIGNAIKGITYTYFRASRSTGRTTTMIDSLKNGDRIIFVSAREAKRVEGLLRERHLSVECRVVPVDQNPRQAMGTGQGRTVFDHSWVEEFYLQKIERAEKDINSLQISLSGFGQEHFDTRAAARELARFQ